MPQKAINYTNTHIYKLVCRDPNITECYVGHTTDFKSRKYKHKAAATDVANKSHNAPVYIYTLEPTVGGIILKWY